jgi:predicted CXXCH cytochrome family protein
MMPPTALARKVVLRNTTSLLGIVFAAFVAGAAPTGCGDGADATVSETATGTSDTSMISAGDRGGDDWAAEVEKRARIRRESALHAAHRKEDDRVACRTCHEDYPFSMEGKVADNGCLECHSEHGDASHTPKSLGSESACGVCHDFEEVGGQGLPAKSCRDCHTGPEGDLPADVSHIRGCAGCHRLHAEPTVMATGVEKSKADPFEPKTCVECHELSSRHGRGEGGCSECHQPHEANRVARGRCAACHARAEGAARVVASADEHGRCVGCHQAHDTVAPARAECRRCHGSEAAVVARNEAKSHTECDRCHKETHNPAVGAEDACADCHKTESKGHPAAGGKGRCSTCHEPHESGKDAAKCTDCHSDLWVVAAKDHGCGDCHGAHESRVKKTACDSCHADQKSAAHGTVAGGCSTCHDAHDRTASAVRSCTTSECHRQSRLPELHRIKEHGDCVSCHGGGHEQAPKSRPRSDCLSSSCHVDEKNHVQARSCVQCHKFYAGRRPG